MRPIKAAIQQIKEASNKGKLVVFIGSGVSINSDIPSWDELINKFQIELPEEVNDSKETDKLKIAQLFKNQSGHKEYIEKIRNYLKYGDAIYNPLYEVIFKLKPVHIVTTNYDDLIEQALNHNNQQYYKISKDSDIPYASYEKFLIKMHGDLKEGNIVLTEDDYLNYESNFPLISTFIRSLIASNLILFIGYSFEDYNLKFLSNKIKYLLGEDFQPMYLLNTGYTSYLYKEYYNEKGIKIIDYYDFIESELEGQISDKEKGHLEKLHLQKGRNLYKLMLYICKYDFFAEKYKNDHIIDVLYKSLTYYFDELNVVKAEELKDFPPFNSEKSYYDGRTLYVQNEELFKLQKKLKNSLKAKRKFLSEYGYKYKELVKFANKNRIWFIAQIRGKGSNRINIPSSEDEELLPGLKYLYKLDFLNLIKYINTLKSNTYNETTIFNLELPFLLYKIGEFHDSYLEFRRIAKKCWENKNYILYFICQNNLKLIKNMLNHDEKMYNGKLDIEVIQKLSEEVDEIDLSNILSSMHTKNSKLHEILEKIGDFRFIYEYINDIDDLTEKIYKSNQLTKQGGFSINSFANNLVDKTWQLWNFTNRNFITSEHYSEHVYIYKKAFEGFIISNSIPNNAKHSSISSSKLDELFPFHIVIILLNVENKTLINMFKEHRINRLKFNDESLEFVKEITENSLNSLRLYNEYNNWLSNKIINSFANLLFLISKFKLKNDFIEKIIKDLLKFKSIEFLHFEESFSSLINSSENINISLLENLLYHCINNEKNFRKPNNLIYTITKQIKKRKTEFLIKNKDTLKLLENFEYSKAPLGTNLLDILYDILPKKSKNIITKKLNRNLENEFNTQLFTTCYENKIPVNNKFINSFIATVDEKISDKKVFSNEVYYIYIIYKIYIDIDEKSIKKQIEKLSKKSSHLEFKLNIKDYKKYENVEIDWLRGLLPDHYDYLSTIDVVKVIIKEFIYQNPDEKWLLNIYFKHFSK